MNPQYPVENQGGSVATAPAPTDGAPQPTAPNPNQPAAPAAGTPNVGDPGVDNGDAGGGNSGQGQPVQDANQGNGSPASGDGDGGARQPRSQRRISELTKTANDYRTLADDLKTENEQLKSLLGTPISSSEVAANVTLPDRSKQQSLSWDEYKQDVVKAATDIADALVKQRLQQIIPEANKEMTVRQYRNRAYDEMQTAMDSIPELNENDEEHYDPELSTEVAQDFKRIFDADPTYRFSDHVKKYFRGRGGRAQTNTNPSGGRQPQASAPALRQTGQSSGNRATKPISQMTADEYKEHLQTQRAARR